MTPAPQHSDPLHEPGKFRIALRYLKGLPALLFADWPSIDGSVPCINDVHMNTHAGYSSGVHVLLGLLRRDPNAQDFLGQTALDQAVKRYVEAQNFCWIRRVWTQSNMLEIAKTLGRFGAQVPQHYAEFLAAEDTKVVNLAPRIAAAAESPRAADPILAPPSPPEAMEEVLRAIVKRNGYMPRQPRPFIIG